MIPSGTSFYNALIRPGVEISVLFGGLPGEFLLRQSLVQDRFPVSRNDLIQAAPRGQRESREDVLVRLPSLRESKWKVTVLQRWVGHVERVEADRFLAAISD